MEFSDRDIGMIIQIIIFIGIPLFFASRWVNMWYWKINKFKENQEEQIRLLKKIAGEEEN